LQQLLSLHFCLEISTAINYEFDGEALKKFFHYLRHVCGQRFLLPRL